jgi:hypothetical protein
MTAPAVPTLRYDGDSVVVDARAVAAGFAPASCVAHRRTGSTVTVSFVSRTPWWVYLTFFAGVIVFLILALVLRKTVVAPAWPICDECRRDRRKHLVLAWAALALWIPAMWAAGAVGFDVLPEGVDLLVFVLAFLLPLMAALVLAARASYATQLKGVVSADGLVVTFPAATFERADGGQEAGSAASTPIAGNATSAGRPVGYDGTILPGR